MRLIVCPLLISTSILRSISGHECPIRPDSQTVDASLIRRDTSIVTLIAKGSEDTRWP